MKLYIKNQLINCVSNLLAYDKAEKALKILNLYFKLFSFDTHSSLALAYTYNQLRLEKQFNDQLELIRKYFEGTFHINFLLSSHYAGKREFDKAITEMNLALKIDQNESIIYNNRGYYKSKNGLYKESILDFNKSIEINPEQAFTYNNKGYSKIMLNEKSGIDDINYSLKKDSNNAVAYVNLAIWESKYGDKNKIPTLIRIAETKKHLNQAQYDIDILRKS